jgi:hypothetical protein
MLLMNGQAMLAAPTPARAEAVSSIKSRRVVCGEELEGVEGDG